MQLPLWACSLLVFMVISMAYSCYSGRWHLSAESCSCHWNCSRACSWAFKISVRFSKLGAMPRMEFMIHHRSLLGCLLQIFWQLRMIHVLIMWLKFALRRCPIHVLNLLCLSTSFTLLSNTVATRTMAKLAGIKGLKILLWLDIPNSLVSLCHI